MRSRLRRCLTVVFDHLPRFISLRLRSTTEVVLKTPWRDQYETTLEEMAAATLDQDFKDELSAIEQWFRVLSEAERTAALYALLQQTTQVQIRFFIQVLQQMAKSHPMSGVLSPANFGEKGRSLLR